MGFGKNIAANYFNAGISAIAPLLALPWYISLLGTKYWGLISFIWVLQAMLSIVNAGLAQALIREVSNLSDCGRNGSLKVAAILFGFERIYWVFSIAIGCLVAYFSSNIITGWLRLGDISIEVGQQVVYAAGIIFVVQFPVALYRSVLFGTGHQVAQNVLASGATVVRHLGGVVVLYFYNTLDAYLIWNVLAAFAETMVTSQLGWRYLGVKRSVLSWDSLEMKKIISLTTNLSLGVFIGVLTLQIDKIVLSWSLPIEQLGYYTIATSVAVGLLQLFAPITNAALPKLVQMQESPKKLKEINLKLLSAILLILIVMAVSYGLLGKYALKMWLRSDSIVMAVSPVLSLLLIGTAMNAIYSVGYINWVAKGAVKKIVWVNAAALIISVALLPTLIERYNLQGAAFGWLIINCLGMLLSLDWLYKDRAVSQQA